MGSDCVVQESSCLLHMSPQSCSLVHHRAHHCITWTDLQQCAGHCCQQVLECESQHCSAFEWRKVANLSSSQRLEVQKWLCLSQLWCHNCASIQHCKAEQPAECCTNVECTALLHTDSFACGDAAQHHTTAPSPAHVLVSTTTWCT